MPPLSRRFSILSSSSASASSSSVCTTFSTFSQKSVQFVVDFDVRNTTHVYSTEGVTTDELWYVAADYDQIKRATRDHGDDLQEEGYDEVLEEAYGDNATEEGEDSIQRSLNDFCKLTQGRGIEKYISLSHWKERSANRKHAIHAVLKAQKQAKDEGKLSGDALEEHIREKYLHKTVVASTFARRMGQADQKAASQTTRTPVARTKSATDKLISAAKSLVTQQQTVAMHIQIPLQIVALNA